MLFIRGLAGVAGVVLIGLVVDRDPWLALLVVALQTAALGGQYLFGGAAVPAGAAIAVGGLTFAAFPPSSAPES